MSKYIDLFITRARSKIGKGQGMITQDELAKKLGLSNNSGISKALDGSRSLRLDTVEQWEKALGYPPGEMLSVERSQSVFTAPTPHDALEILADAFDRFILPASAPKEIGELLRTVDSPADWQKVEEALKLALVPGYAESVLGEDQKENAG